MIVEPIRSIKGTQDILPSQSWRWQAVETIIHEMMNCYGYGEIRTPAFEKTELFTRGVGAETDIVGKEMYSWVDQGGSNLTLKPELTAPVVRAYIQNNLGGQNPLIKLYYIDALFRRERPQKGRYRQFHQFGVEAFGSVHPELDAEIIALSFEILKALGIKNMTLRLNTIGSPECQVEYRKAIRDFLQPFFDDLSTTSQRRFETNPLRILDTKVPHEIEILKTAPAIKDSLSKEDREHFTEVCNLLNALDIPFVLEPRLVRGLDYYTRTTFEITSTALGSQNALCGGGRYDELVEILGGKSTPGIGFAAGIERILLVLNNTEKESHDLPQIFIIGLGDNVREMMMQLVQTLRRKGLRTLFDPLRRSLKAQMREANKLGTMVAVIIGDQELSSGVAQVKDLVEGKQIQVPLNSLAKHLCSLPF